MAEQARVEDLGNMVGDKSDEQLNALIKGLEGQDGGMIKAIFDGMEQRFLPDKAAGRSAVIQYDINLPEGTQSWQVDVAGGQCTTSQGGDKEAQVTLVLGAPDFLRLMSGKLNGVQAFMSGKLKLKGDMMLAQTMQGWFDQT
jgi:putative sterol carrier protein